MGFSPQFLSAVLQQSGRRLRGKEAELSGGCGSSRRCAAVWLEMCVMSSIWQSGAQEFQSQTGKVPLDGASGAVITNRSGTWLVFDEGHDETQVRSDLYAGRYKYLRYFLLLVKHI